jgi:uncharacterized membrane protein
MNQIALSKMSPLQLWRRGGQFTVAGFFIFAGIWHFMRPSKFIQITPDYLPCKKELVYVSGIFEIIGGLGLLFPWTQKLAGKGLIALLLAVFPANINMAVKKTDFGFIPHWLLWARLPLQFLLIAAVKAVSGEPVSRD